MSEMGEDLKVRLPISAEDQTILSRASSVCEDEDRESAGSASPVDSYGETGLGAQRQDFLPSSLHQQLQQAGYGGGISVLELHQLMTIHAQLASLQAATSLVTSQPTSLPVPPSIPVSTTTAPSAAAVGSGVPQLLLAGGRLAPHGIQGAQLLVPTASGLSVRPILAIPMNGDSPQTVATSESTPLLPSILGYQHPVSSAASVLASVAAQYNQLGSHHVSSGTAHSAKSRSPDFQQQLELPSLKSTTTPTAVHHHLDGPPRHHQQLQQHLTSADIKPHHHHHQQQQQLAALGYGAAAVPLPHQLLLPAGYSGHQPSAAAGGLDAVTAAELLLDPFRDAANQPTINQTSSNEVDGINLAEVREFARAFKMRRLSLGLTQTQVGQALSVSMGPAYSQSAICRFEKLDITPKSALRIKPILEKWMHDAEERHRLGGQTMVDYCGLEPSKKRKRRTSFSPQALEVLNAHFQRNTHPSGQEISHLSAGLGYEREVVRIWFCNKRQALKNAVRLVSKPRPLSQPQRPQVSLVSPPSSLAAATGAAGIAAALSDSRWR